MKQYQIITHEIHESKKRKLAETRKMISQQTVFQNLLHLNII